MPDRARTLGQVIGVEKLTRQKDNLVGAELKKKVQSEPLIKGLTKVYFPDDENAPSTAREPDQYKAVAVTAENALAEAAKYSAAALDVVATKDAANQHARADIVVNGETLVPDVPVSHLLFLENYIGEWKGFLAALPVLDPTRHWTISNGTGVHRADTEETVRFTKEVVPLVLHPGTPQHPPQVQAINKDTRVGRYETTILSGAVDEKRKKHLLDNADTLLAAIKDAIAVANRTTVAEKEEGTVLLDFLLT